MAYTQQILDVTIWLGIAMLFNYFILYRKNRFFGNLGFLGMGVLMLYILPADTLYAGIGMFIIIASLISGVYDITEKFGKRKMK